MWLTEAVRKRIDLVGFVDIKLAAAKQRREDFAAPDAAVGKDLASVIKQTGAEIVFNCTIPKAHHATCLTALRNGCHVIVEKPLADSMQEARELVRTAKRTKRVLSVIQNRRYTPQIRSLRAFLDSGRIGKLTTVHCSFFIGAHFGGFRDFMKHPLLLDMAIHSFDQGRFISNQDSTHVYCHAWNPSGSWYKHGASASAIFEMTNDVVFAYQGSWCSEGCDTSWDCEWRIIGEKGTVLWDGADAFTAERVTGKGRFILEKQPLNIPIRAPKRKTGGHEGVILEFLDSVRKGAQPETSVADNVHSLAMVFGAIESAATKKRVRIK